MFVKPFRIAVSDNRAKLGKIEKGDIPAWRTFNGSFRNVEIPPLEFVRLVKRGYAYTAQHSGYRHSDNFVAAQHLGLDFDTEDPRSTFEMILEDEFISKYVAFLHTTPSHTSEKPRARAVFLLEEPVFVKDKYAELAEALVFYFNAVDGSCKDPARFFYGAKDCDIKWVGNTFDRTAARIVLKKYRDHKRAQEARLLEAAKSRVIVGTDSIPASWLERRSNTLLSRVMHAPDGSKHNVLRDIAMTFGGYVAGGYYDAGEVVQWLQNAIRQNPGNVLDYKAADKTIEKSLRYGMTKPLYFEKGYVNELDAVHPPLQDVQKEQVNRIIREREWLAYHKALKESGRNIGFPDSIVDHFSFGYRERMVDEETGVIVPSAITVPYVSTDGVTSLEYRDDYGGFEYDGVVGLYTVTPIIPEETKFSIVLPDSLIAVNCYLSGDGNGAVYGMPHAAVGRELPDDQLYCIITADENRETLEALDKHGAKFVKVGSVETMLKNLSRSQIETIATKGKRLAGVV
jgi:hypothetical protein